MAIEYFSVAFFSIDSIAEYLVLLTSALRAPSRPAYGGPPVHMATGGHSLPHQIFR